MHGADYVDSGGAPRVLGWEGLASAFDGWDVERGEFLLSGGWDGCRHVAELGARYLELHQEWSERNRRWFEATGGYAAWGPTISAIAAGMTPFGMDE